MSVSHVRPGLLEAGQGAELFDAQSLGEPGTHDVVIVLIRYPKVLREQSVRRYARRLRLPVLGNLTHAT